MTRFAVDRLFIAIHRYVGLVTLVFLALAAITGCVLVFFDQLDVLANTDLFISTKSGPLHSATDLATMIDRRYHGLRIVSLPLRIESNRNIKMKVVARAGSAISYNEIYVDPHDGHVAGTRNDETIAFDRHHLMPMIYIFHYTLLAGSFGRYFMGAVAALWLLEVLVGFYLTLPAKPPFWQRWKTMWKVRGGVAWPRFLLDLHQASGLWLFILLILYAVTSFSLNLYYEAVEPAVLAVSPRKMSPLYEPGKFDPSTHIARRSFADALAAGTARARAVHLAAKAAWIVYDPSRGVYGVEFTPLGDITYRGSGPVAYYFDDASAQFRFADDPGHDSDGQWALRSIFPLHSGQIAGRWSEAAVFILGLAIVEMSVSGLIVWWKKRRPRVEARKAARARTLGRGSVP